MLASSVARRGTLAAAALATTVLLATAGPVSFIGPEPAAACQNGSACGG
jgi:hypothetical protein